MLRPERMSKVSVTGSRSTMTTVIETIHDLELVHLSDYDGSWSGFENGDPIEGADEIAERLVTVRALESSLDLDSEEPVDRGPLEDGWEERLESVRTEVTELDDELGTVREQLRQVDERIDRVQPFAELGIDLDLLSGYETVDVVVGEGKEPAIETALEESDDVRAYELFGEGDVTAVVAAPAAQATLPVIDDAIVGLEFVQYDVPAADQSPEDYLASLREERADLETSQEDLEAELEELADDHGEFLLHVEHELTMQLDQAEAPLQFATTKRSFIAEGWIPTASVDNFVTALESTVGDRLEIEELERATFDGHDEHEPTEETAVSGEPSGEAVADGGTVVTMDDDPPVVLDNLRPAKPFEMMVKMVNQPKYSELDPTLLVFLTYPIAFGFMIGDVGYGLMYMAMGAFLYKGFDSDAMKAIGTIGIWAGLFTAIFGYLYDDYFGVHIEYVSKPLFEALPLAGSLSKGLQASEWALLWIVISILFGLLHLNIGLVMGFVNELRHGIKAAVLERLSWILAMNGLFVWVFSTHLVGQKPDFIVGPNSTLAAFVGFTGLPEVVGMVGLGLALLGVIMVGFGEGIAGVAETPAWAFGHALSYLRMTAVLLAKAGMAFVVNLLVFGGYADSEGYTVFNLPTYDVSGYEQEFVGLLHIEPAWLGLPAAVLIFVLGHVLVLVLGITAAGIQMLRLEYVEFFQKFYEGGGEVYDPFGSAPDQGAD